MLPNLVKESCKFGYSQGSLLVKFLQIFLGIARKDCTGTFSGSFPVEVTWERRGFGAKEPSMSGGRLPFGAFRPWHLPKRKFVDGKTLEGSPLLG